jgi:hypothetical protein
MSQKRASIWIRFARRLSIDPQVRHAATRASARADVRVSAATGSAGHTRCMMWAKAALVGGLLMLVAAFAIGTEKQLSASVLGQTQDCGPSISASWLVPGTPDRTHPSSAATDDERRAAGACRPVVHEFRVLVVTVMGLGCLLALVGWGAVGTRGEIVSRPVRIAQF